MSIPSGVETTNCPTAGSQEGDGSSVVDNNANSGGWRRRGGNTSTGVLTVVGLLRSPIMETVHELREVGKDEVVVVPCSEIRGSISGVVGCCPRD